MHVGYWRWGGGRAFSVREEGHERAGSGIPKGGGAGAEETGEGDYARLRDILLSKKGKAGRSQ